ncbi:MAG: hypothetical protein M1814_006450 [Vezdaea aestivalis]|nr:MAG: hypothetical protein M1814_006450 [Vezdaea aestivalis]
MEKPTPYQGPSSKEKKYDRQLRLWAASGQTALENAHILLLNSGSGVVGVETLKNLVLPGIGNFTIVDPTITSEADLGVNFFLKEVGVPRAKGCCDLLLELNPDVKGNFYIDDVEEFLRQPGSLSAYTHIILSGDMSPHGLEVLMERAKSDGIPLFRIHCTGFYSQFSLCLPSSFPIVDTHPDPETTSDLRLLCPWPELQEFMASKTANIESLSDHEHGHIPYILVLLHYLEKWKDSHDGLAPQNYKTKVQFRELVSDATRTDNAEGWEENFEEAVGAVIKSLNPPHVSADVKEIITAPECEDLSAESSNFWIIASAINKFYIRHKVLPIPGAVPDMKAQSADYIKLQTIYKAKAREDCAEVVEIVRELEAKHGITGSVPQSEVEAFCKGAAFIKLLKGCPLFSFNRDSELKAPGARAKYFWSELQDAESLMPIHFAFIVQDLALIRQRQSMSDGDMPSEEDLLECWSRVLDVLKSGLPDTIQNTEEASNITSNTMDIVKELQRTQGGELHNIASLTGGLVAQEVIKVVTKQYIPIDNTCVFDGIRSKSSVIQHY